MTKLQTIFEMTKSDEDICLIIAHFAAIANDYPACVRMYNFLHAGLRSTAGNCNAAGGDRSGENLVIPSIGPPADYGRRLQCADKYMRQVYRPGSSGSR